MMGAILFLSCLFVCRSVCLSVCLSVVNFNICYNFWTIRGRDFIFGMHTLLMKPFQMTPRSMTLTLTFALKNVATGGIVSVSQTPIDFLVHLSRRLKCTIVITRCPSSVRPSVCPSVVNFSHFRLLLWNGWTEFNETWQEARSQRPLPSLCFSGRSEKQDGRPGLWLAETFSTSPLKPLNGIQRNLTGSKILMSSSKFVFFGPIGKTRWPPWPLIGWDIFNFSTETVERNSTKLDRKQDLNALYQVCVFGADRKNKMATLASDWLRHFRLLLWNRWTEFN